MVPLPRLERGTPRSTILLSYFKLLKSYRIRFAKGCKKARFRALFCVNCKALWQAVPTTGENG